VSLFQFFSNFLVLAHQFNLIPQQQLILSINGCEYIPKVCDYVCHRLIDHQVQSEYCKLIF
jgi:hypothetical protein